MGGYMVYSFQVMRPTGKKVIDWRDKKTEILKKLKMDFCKMTNLIVVVVPRCQNSSWWDRVGGPESVAKSQKSRKTGENQKK
jgi:hypothetical protein